MRKYIQHATLFILLIALTFQIATSFMPSASAKKPEIVKTDCLGIAKLAGWKGVDVFSDCNDGLKFVTLTRTGNPNIEPVSSGSLTIVKFFDHITIYSSDPQDTGFIEFKIEQEQKTK